MQSRQTRREELKRFLGLERERQGLNVLYAPHSLVSANAQSPRAAKGGAGTRLDGLDIERMLRIYES